jgi:nitrile hydratase accessory protein
MSTDANKAAGMLTALRADGDATFREPWEARAFALVLALVEAGVIEYEDFRQCLIAEIAQAETRGESATGSVYYQCWLRAFEKLLGLRGILRTAEIDQRAGTIAASPPVPAKPAFRGFVKAS